MHDDDETSTPTLKDAWAALDAIEAMLRREESAARTSPRYPELMANYNRRWFELVPRAREGQAGHV
jgi:hypothetical protein